MYGREFTTWEDSSPKSEVVNDPECSSCWGSYSRTKVRDGSLVELTVTVSSADVSQGVTSACSSCDSCPTHDVMMEPVIDGGEANSVLRVDAREDDVVLEKLS